jgi:hypothetical protein
VFLFPSCLLNDAFGRDGVFSFLFFYSACELIVNFSFTALENEPSPVYVTLANFDVQAVLHGKTLVGSGGQEYDEGFNYDGMTAQQRIETQRKIINQKLGVWLVVDSFFFELCLNDCLSMDCWPDSLGLEHLDIKIMDDSDLLLDFPKSGAVKQGIPGFFVRSHLLANALEVKKEVAPQLSQRIGGTDCRRESEFAIEESIEAKIAETTIGERRSTNDNQRANHC